MKNNINIHIGFLAKPLLEQVTEQGYRFKDTSDCSIFVNYIDQVTRLMFAGIITRTEADKIYNRIVKMIASSIEELK